MSELINKTKKFFQRNKKTKDLPARCDYIINHEIEEKCGAIMQQVGNDWICTRDNRHRHSIAYSNSKFLPALCAYVIDEETEEICGSAMQQIGSEWICTKDNKHSYPIGLPPGIYRVEESESYRDTEIDKAFIKKILDADATSDYVHSFEKLTGIKLEED